MKKLSGAVGAAAAVGAEIPAARAGMQPGLRVVAAASAIGAAVPAGAASAGDFDDVGRRRGERRERHGARGATGCEQRAGEEASSEDSLHGSSPENAGSVRSRVRDAGAHFGNRAIDEAERLLAVA